MSEYYYQVHLEVVLRKKPKHVFGFINISHIPYIKLQELFKPQITTERFLFDESFSYFIDSELYDENKRFFDSEIPFTFDFKLFSYGVSLAGDLMENYKKDYHEELPPLL